MIKIYENRIVNLKFSTQEEILEVLENSDKDFYFVLIYFYLIDKDLSELNLNNSGILRQCIYSFCNKLKYNSITKYYSKYINFREITEEIFTMKREIEQLSK